MSVNLEGVGERSWAYSAVIDNMFVERIFIEESGEVKEKVDDNDVIVSDVNTMINYLSSKD